MSKCVYIRQICLKCTKICSSYTENKTKLLFIFELNIDICLFVHIFLQISFKILFTFIERSKSFFRNVRIKLKSFNPDWHAFIVCLLDVFHCFIFVLSSYLVWFVHRCSEIYSDQLVTQLQLS